MLLVCATLGAADAGAPSALVGDDAYLLNSWTVMAYRNKDANIPPDAMILIPGSKGYPLYLQQRSSDECVLLVHSATDCGTISAIYQSIYSDVK